MRSARGLLILIAALFSCDAVKADEGMWMPQQVPGLANRLLGMGFKGNPKTFADLTGQPMGAVVSLGGCTASFVSPEGLIATNHHCVTGALQFNSNSGRDLLKDGYLAGTREQELYSGPGARVYVTTSVADVTEAITGNINQNSSDRQRYDTIQRRIKERVAACEKEGIRCNVASFFEGLKYFEIVQLEIKDVRLVYSPAEGIGVFGGETDNWRWPRHTGDWSFLRAYVGKDGQPAAFAKDNVPYRPKHWLKVSPDGAKPGELVFVVGYPGRTQRHQTYDEVKETAEWYYPRAIRNAQEQLAVLNQAIKGDRELALKAAGRIQGLNNTLTNQKGVLEGLVKGGILAQKEAQEKELAAWTGADPARREKYGDVLPGLAALNAEGRKTRERDATLAGLASASSYFSAAQTLYRLAGQRPLKDVERDPGFQERDWGRIREAQQRLQRSLDPQLDRALFRWALGKAATLAADQRIEPLDKAIGLKPGMPAPEAEKTIDSWLAPLYAGTRIGNSEFRLGLMEKGIPELEATGDTFIALAAKLHPLSEAIREAGKNEAGAYARLRPRYMEAVLARAGGLVAPDANSTLRVTYGQVKGVDARDGLFYKPQTTLAGIVEKHTGEGEFDAPQKQLDAVRALRSGKATPYIDPTLKDVPVNFLSTVDTTGGNSGSPTLNSKGDLVGLLFDGTYETVASNFIFDRDKTRSIHVDSRYMLWIMSEVDGATRLLGEMSLSGN
jgi:hypothetical protein